MPHEHGGEQNFQARGFNDSPSDDHVRKIERLLRSVVETLVEEKKLVQLNSRTDDAVTTLLLKVAPQDIEKVVGEHGSIARSLRTIVQCIGNKQQRRIMLDISEISQGGISQA